MSENVFFEKKGPFPLRKILNTIGYNGELKNLDNLHINGFESLDKANSKDMTFLNSSKYQNISIRTKAAVCITTLNLSKFLPEKCIKVDVKNVLFAVTKASKMFYPTADVDYPDKNLPKPKIWSEGLNNYKVKINKVLFENLSYQQYKTLRVFADD